MCVLTNVNVYLTVLFGGVYVYLQLLSCLLEPNLKYKILLFLVQKGKHKGHLGILSSRPDNTPCGQQKWCV